MSKSNCSLNNNGVLQKIPRECMGDMDSISSYNWDMPHQPGDTFDVIVTHIRTPYDFWFQTYNENLFNCFKEMMEDLNKFYNSVENLPSMSPNLMKRYQYCAAKVGTVWYRAVVLGPATPKGNVKIRLADYGTTTKVKISSLLPLQTLWSRLPKMAIRAKLDIIIPRAKDISWLSTFFYVMVVIRQRFFQAVVVELDTYNSKVIPKLTLKHSSEDLTVNEAMLAACEEVISKACAREVSSQK